MEEIRNKILEKSNVRKLNILRGFSEIEEIEKARHGTYKDNPENQRLKRVGQQYGSKKSEDTPNIQTKPEEQDSSSSESGEKGEPGSSVAKFAKETSTEDLKDFLEKNPNSSFSDIAKKELESRGEFEDNEGREDIDFSDNESMRNFLNSNPDIRDRFQEAILNDLFTPPANILKDLVEDFKANETIENSEEDEENSGTPTRENIIDTAQNIPWSVSMDITDFRDQVYENLGIERFKSSRLDVIMEDIIDDIFYEKEEEYFNSFEDEEEDEETDTTDNKSFVDRSKYYEVGSNFFEDYHTLSYSPDIDKGGWREDLDEIDDYIQRFKLKLDDDNQEANFDKLERSHKINLSRKMQQAVDKFKKTQSKDYKSANSDDEREDGNV